jgi:Holliday junction resolvasome RuvABC DNA-binding subunit
MPWTSKADSDESDALFHEAETARLLLMKIRQMFETPEQSSTLVKLGLSRKMAREAANKALQNRNVYGFTQLSEYVNSLESAWKSKQPKVR